MNDSDQFRETRSQRPATIAACARDRRRALMPAAPLIAHRHSFPTARCSLMLTRPATLHPTTTHMRRFQSTAARLAAVSRQEQRLAELVLGQRQAELRRAEADCDRRRDELTAGEAAVAAALERGATPSLLTTGSLHLDRLRAVLEAARRQVAAARETVREAAEALRRQRARAEALSRVEDRDRRAHRAETLAAEQQALDEQGLARRLRETTPEVTHG